MTHPNEELLRSFYKAQVAQDYEAALDCLADDVVWHTAPVSDLGVFRGKQEVGGLWDRLLEMTDGTFTFEVHDILANDEHAVGLVRVRARRGDKTLDEPNVHLFHVADGKLTEFWPQPYDAAKFAEFFA